MNAIVEAKVEDYLKYRLYYGDLEAKTVVQKMRVLARMAGHDVDDRFAFAGLGAGPEARVASRLVGVATLGGGSETPEYAMRKEIDWWLVTTGPLGT